MARTVSAVAGLALAPAVFARGGPPAEVAAEIPDARLQGVGRLTFLTLHVYDARLWVGEDFAADRAEQATLALEIEYARSLHGTRIAERTLQEMQRPGRIGEVQAERWLAWMRATFPDVHKGDRLTGVHRPGESAHFYFNGRSRGELRDGDFARRFFAIWLGAHTSEPALRDSLLGAAR